MISLWARWLRKKVVPLALVSPSALFRSNTLHFIILSSPILALERAELKNKNGLRFNIFKSIETNVNLPTKNIQFYPLLELYFASRWGGHEKQWQIRFPHPQKYLQKYWNLNYFNRKTLNFISHLGPNLSPHIGRTWKIMADSDSASPKILKSI